MEHQMGTNEWRVNTAPFDYAEWEACAMENCAAIKAIADRLNAERPRTAERERLRRRELRILTDMYYEQKSNARLFHAKSAQRAAVFSRRASLVNSLTHHGNASQVGAEKA